MPTKKMVKCPTCGGLTSLECARCEVCGLELPDMSSAQAVELPVDAQGQVVCSVERPAVLRQAPDAVQERVENVPVEHVRTFKYKVITFDAAISEDDLDSGEAYSKVSKQTQDLLTAQSQAGWEFYGNFPVDVRIAKGCLSSLLGNRAPDTLTLTALVFRRPVDT